MTKSRQTKTRGNFPPILFGHAERRVQGEAITEIPPVAKPARTVATAARHPRRTPAAVGRQGIRYLGRCPVTGKALCALVPSPLGAAARDAIYRAVAPDARQQMLLAKRWGLWAVIAGEEWAKAHMGLEVAP